MTTTLDKLKNSVIPSALAGASAVGIYYLLYGDISTPVPFGPMEMPVWGAIGGSVAVGNMVGEITTEFVLPMIPKNEKFQGYEEKIVPPVLSGLGSYLAMRFLVSENTSLFESMAIGAGGSIAGKYIYGI